MPRVLREVGGRQIGEQTFKNRALGSSVGSQGKGDSRQPDPALELLLEAYAQVLHVPLPPQAKDVVTVFPEGQATGWPITNGSRSQLGVVASPAYLKVAGQLGSWPLSLHLAVEQCVLSGVPRIT